MSVETGDRSDLTGRLVAGRYRLGELLGRGGMGSVWHARDELLDREVAVKTVNIPHGLPEEEREELRQRSMREARTAARLHHRSAITVHDVVMEDGHPCIVMEYVRSRSLHDVVTADGPLSSGKVAEIGLAVLGALRTAHSVGVLHRDVKPSNVLLEQSGRVVLTDFGIARYEGDSQLTMTGRIMGSAGFLAPELAQGTQRANAGSDLWSLGATLYAAVEGRPPYNKTSVIARLTAAVTEDPEPMQLAGPLAPVITGLMQKDQAARLDGEAAERMLADVLTSWDTSPAGMSPADATTQAVAATGQTSHTAPAGAAPATGTPATGAPGKPGQKRSRRRLAILLPLLLVAGLIAGAAAFYLPTRSQKDDPRPPAQGLPAANTPSTSPRPSLSATPAPTPTKPTKAPKRPQAPGVPGGTTLVDIQEREFGFAIKAPQGWERTVDQNFVKFMLPGTAKERPDLLVSVRTAGAGTSAVTAIEETEAGFAADPDTVDYKKIRLGAVTGAASAQGTAQWEYTHRRPDGNVWHVVNQHVVVDSGKLFAIRWRVPEGNFQETSSLANEIMNSFVDLSTGDAGG